jgi:GNAT superfamily N-acetyltransferase
MSVNRHTDPDAFLAAAQPALARSETAAAAFAAWVGALKASTAPDGDVYLATYAHDRSVGAAMRRPDGPVVFENADPAAAAAFAHDLAADCPRLSGIVGTLPACESFAHAWSERTGRVHVLRFHMRHFMLTAVADVPAAIGAPRVAGDGDCDWLKEAQYAFLVEVGVSDNPERIMAAVPRRVAGGHYWIWDDTGAKALAAWTPAGDDAARIAPVYTLPGARTRGYATALVAALSRALLAGGRQRLFLLTDVANPTSNAVYSRIGFRPQSDIYHFDFVDRD